MPARSTPRKWRRVAAGAVALGVGAAIPACAFWEVDDWDDHADDALDGGADAGNDADAKHDAAGDAEAGVRSFCSTAPKSAIFCDDFDGEPDAWTSGVACIACSESIGPDDAAPSPPDVYFAEGPTGESAPSVFRTKTLTGKFTSVSGDFWGYVDTATSDGQPAFQELAYEVDSDNYIRVRIYVFVDKLWIGTGVTASSLSKATFDNSHSITFGTGGWHHVTYNIASTGPVPTYSWTVDGTKLLDREPILDGEKVVGDFTRVDLRSGVFYVGIQPKTGTTRFRMDNVVLTAP